MLLYIVGEGSLTLGRKAGFVIKWYHHQVVAGQNEFFVQWDRLKGLLQFKTLILGSETTR
jgi:hypothetical protein